MSDLTSIFPRLTDQNYRTTSPATASYNCIAWAAQDSERWWWPDAFGLYYWPMNALRTESLEAFEQAYAELGYEVCENGVFENNFEKVALYADKFGSPTHAARQLLNGRWTSKCGQLEDIEHELNALTGQSYGNVSRYMKRPQSNMSS